jgi:histidine triad (HIT) family protein
MAEHAGQSVSAVTPPAPCVFCAIVAGSIPAAIVARGEGWLAFLDTKPVFHGHVLVVPDVHLETLLDVPTQRLAPLFAAVQRVAHAVTGGLACDGTFVAMNNKVSQSVPHLHVHVVPRRKKDGLRGFFWPRQKYASDDELEGYRARIEAALA